jgi:hypothetical protein
MQRSIFDGRPGSIAMLDVSLAARDIDARYASRLAFMLECMVVDSHGHWNESVKLLDEYKAACERINPSPPTFMGEPLWQEKEGGTNE